MNTAIYALVRLILFGFGWAVAALMAFAAEMTMTSAKWPVFGVFAAWWTYVCAVYVLGEAESSTARRDVVSPDARRVEY